MNIGGQQPAGTHNPIKMGEVGQSGGSGTYTRFDGNLFYDGFTGVDFATLGSMEECRTNYCRYEMCMDIDSDGFVHARFKKVVLPPGNGRVFQHEKPKGNHVVNNINFATEQTSSVLVIYKQNVPGPDIIYATHGMVAQRNSYDPNFWVGAACEVEGGCSGSPPPPPPPASPPQPPTLLP
jgi:hypothetical protein